MSKKRKAITAVIVIVVLVAAAAAAYYIYNAVNSETSLTTNTTAAPTEGETTSVPAEYQEYYNRNNDFVGWIKIDGTEIDYPVVQAEDNDYYLNHNLIRKRNRGERYLWIIPAIPTLGI